MANGHGGKREGAGRPKGSTNKIQGDEFLSKYKEFTGEDLTENIIESMHNLHVQGDDQCFRSFVIGLSKYLFDDVKKVDITTDGDKLGGFFNITKETKK